MIIFLLVESTSFAQQNSNRQSDNREISRSKTSQTANKFDNRNQDVKRSTTYSNNRYQLKTDRNDAAFKSKNGKQNSKSNKTYKNNHNKNYSYGNHHNVPAKVGVRVPTLHRNFARIDVGNSVYFYYNGVFCMPDRVYHDYRVVTPPMGIIVNSIPNYAVRMVIGGHKYWSVEGTIYKQIYFGNRPAFKVVGAMS